MDSTQLSTNTYLLGSFKIKATENLIITGSEDIVVPPKVMSLLIYLCENSQKVVTFDELTKAIWPNEFVGDNAIYNLIGQLRKALNDNASNPIYIQSISKVGYRLMVEAIPAEVVEESAKPQYMDAPNVTSKALADNNLLRKPRVLVAILVVFTLLVLFFRFLVNAPNYTPDNQRQLKVAQYQLQRADLKGLDQAIEMLQQLAITAPNWSEPKVELAVAFMRKSNLEPNNKEFWLNKAKSIVTNAQLGESKKALELILNIQPTSSHFIDKLTEELNNKEIPTSLVIASSDILFEIGETNIAKNLLESAINGCMDCPYLYRKLAKSYMTMGNIQQGLASYSNYRQLINRSNSTPAQDVGLIVLDFNSLQEMASWHFQSNLSDNLLTSERNTLALFYLSLGLIDQAESILSTTIETSASFFDLYTHAAIAGAKGEFQTTHSILEKRQASYPDNKRFKLSLVYSLWQLEKYSEALELLKRFDLITTADKLPEFIPFSPWAMYGDLLIQTGKLNEGQNILNKLEQQLITGLMPNSQSADIRLASVFALQNKNEQALSELLTAIQQGWVSDFHQNWWYIQDSPYFRQLKDDNNFKAAVNLYHDKISTLRKSRILE